MEINFITLILALLAIFGMYQWMQKRKNKSTLTPALFFSDLSLLHSTQNTWKLKLHQLPFWLYVGTLILFLAAFTDPHFYIPKPVDITNEPREGIAIYLVLDQSGSMNSKITALTGEKQLITVPKMDWMKQVTEQFIKGNPKIGLEGRKNDLIGLVSFARVAKVLVPLTLDHSAILKNLKQIHVVKDENQDGTAIGYALYKTATIITATRHYSEDLSKSNLPSYDIKSAVIILVTDGFHSPHPDDANNPLRSMDLIQAAKFVNEKNVHVYIVNIEPALASAEFAPERHQMQEVAELTGGKYFLISDTTGLSEVYAEIDKLEKSLLPQINQPLSKDEQPQKYRRISLYPYIIALGMALLCCAVLTESLWIRRIP